MKNWRIVTIQRIFNISYWFEEKQSKMDVKTVIWGFNEEQLEEIVNRDTNVWTMNACLFSLKPYQWYIHWVQKKIFTKCTNTDTEGGMIKGSFEGERELEIKSCVGDRIWKWGITQCFFKRMRKYYMKTRVKEMHIGKLDKEFNTYYEKKEGTHVHWMMNLWEI